MNLFNYIKSTLQKQNMLTILIVLNVAVFLTVNIGMHLAHLNLLPYLAMPVNTDYFILRFWTIFTYMFTHSDLFHLFFNLILLFFSGQLFCSFLGEKRFLYVYILGGLSGAILLIIGGLIFPLAFAVHVLLGASASVMAIVMVMALYTPDLPVNVFFFLQMKYKYFAILLFLLSTIIDFSINTGGKIAHIGGASFGLIFGFLLKKGKDLSAMSLFEKKSGKLKVIKNQTTKSRGDDEVILNNLLDKISKSGYDSLSNAERQELFRLSNKK